MFLPLLSIALAKHPYPPGYDLPLYMHRHEVKNARARNAVCNDGSPAVFYYRGCNETYYKGDLGGCDPEGVSIWSIVFGSAAEYCYDEASCKARAKHFPLLTTSTTQNASTVIDGLVGRKNRQFPVFHVCPFYLFDSQLQPFPESNPNFYKSHGVFVPYCSSDFWLGNTSATFVDSTDGTHGMNGGGKKTNFEFRGAAIMKAVMEDLLDLAPSGHDDDGETEHKYRYPVRNASYLLLTGGPGVAAQADTIVKMLPAKVQENSRLVCDGCVVKKKESDLSLHVYIYVFTCSSLSIESIYIRTLPRSCYLCCCMTPAPRPRAFHQVVA